MTLIISLPVALHTVKMNLDRIMRERLEDPSDTLIRS